MLAEGLRGENVYERTDRLRFVALFPVCRDNGKPWLNSEGERIAASLVVTGLRLDVWELPSNLPALRDARNADFTPEEIAAGLAGTEQRFELEQLWQNPAAFGLFTADKDYGVRPDWIDDGDSAKQRPR